jgi:hypothetical protein
MFSARGRPACGGLVIGSVISTTRAPMHRWHRRLEYLLVGVLFLRQNPLRTSSLMSR